MHQLSSKHLRSMADRLLLLPIPKMSKNGRLVKQAAITLRKIADGAVVVHDGNSKSLDNIHTCSYYCNRIDCIRQQRDDLRDRLERTNRADGQPRRK